MDGATRIPNVPYWETAKWYCPYIQMVNGYLCQNGNGKGFEFDLISRFQDSGTLL